MTDITERLRDLARNYSDGVAGMGPRDHFAWEAAAEIERLRAALLTVPCPGGGYTGMPAGTEPTVAACLTAGACGCSYGDALKATS